MSRINDIENTLKQLEGGKFQKLCNELLYALDYGKITNSGGEIATDKTRKGTPDAYILQPNGKFTFIEYTVQQPGVFKKFKDDINKCLDEKKTNVSIDDIDKIIIMYNSVLQVDELNSLNKMCMDNNINFEYFDISIIGQYLNNQCAYLAKEYLNIELDSGQMINVSKFIEYNDNNRVSTPLGIKIYNRENELQEILNELEKNDLIILAGKPGVGKTRLSLEACKEYKDKYSDCAIWCIKNNGQNLYEDVKRNIKDKGEYLIFIDDANQTSNLEIILSQLNKTDNLINVKIIVTVRDYALKNIVDVLKKYTIPKLIKVDILKDEIVKKIAKEEFNIKNSIFLDRIEEISKGNARIAVMASKVAIRTNKYESIHDVTKILQEYYIGIKNQISLLDDINILKSIGLICFFNTINLKDDLNIDNMCKIAGIQKNQFREAINKLNNKEIVDVYENQVIKISDQILSVYLFNLVFIEKELIDFTELLNYYFPQLKNRIIELINAIYTYYKNNLSISFFNKHINKVWDHMDTTNDSRLNDFMLIFCSVRQEETLLYIQRYIEKIIPQCGEISYDIKKKDYEELDIHISTLAQYRNWDSFDDALCLLFEYLKKLPRDFKKVYSLIIGKLGIDMYSFDEDYFIQLKIVSEIIKYANKWSNKTFTILFLKVSSNYLQFTSEYIEGKGINQYVIHNINVVATEGAYRCRNIIWNALLDLIRENEYRDSVIEVLEIYSKQNTYNNDIDSNIVVNDSLAIKKIITSELIYSNFKECVIADKLINNINRYCNDLKGVKIEKIYNNEEFELYKTLKKDRFLEEFDFDREQILRKEYLRNYICNYIKDDFNKLFIKCNTLNSLNEYEISKSIGIIFSCIENNELFVSSIESYLKNNTPCHVCPDNLIYRLIEIIGVEDTEKLIRSYEYVDKSDWLFYFFESIPEKLVSDKYLNKIIDYFETDSGSVHGWLHNLKFLKHYIKIEPNVFCIIVKKIVDRASEDSFKFIINLSLLFNYNNEIYKNVIVYFKNDIEVLESAYINMLLSDRSSVGDNSEIFKELVKQDNAFLNRVLFLAIENMISDKINLSFIWDLENYNELLSLFIDSLELDDLYLSYEKEKCLKSIFNIKKDSKELINKQNKWLKDYMEKIAFNNIKIYNIFEIICTFNEERRIELILFILGINKSFDLFKEIRLLPSISARWSGSKVNIISKEIEYYEKIIKSLRGIEYIEHRHYLEDLNRKLKIEKEEVKIKEFLRDY